MSSENDHTTGTQPDFDPRAAARAVVESNVARIAAELAALGEAPLDHDEQASLAGRAADGVPFAVRSVDGLVSLARPLPAPPDPLVRPLTELELARIYRRVALRLPAAARTGVVPVPAHGADDHGGARRSIWTALTVVAAAAAFVLVPALGGGDDSLDTPQTRQQARAQTAAVGQAVRSGLDALGPSGSARAQALARAYAQRMDAPMNAPMDAPKNAPMDAPVEPEGDAQ